MDVTNEVMPTSRERIGEMMEPVPRADLHGQPAASSRRAPSTRTVGPPICPVAMPTGSTGRGEQVDREFGGEITFAGDVTFLALGQVEDLWDEVAIAQYPNRDRRCWEMSTSSPEWQAIGCAPSGRARWSAKHRDRRFRVHVINALLRWIIDTTPG